MRTILLLLPFLCSCAMTFGRGPFAVPVDSVPQGAIVSYRGHDVGRTPCTVSMTPASVQLVLRHDGYHPQEVVQASTSNAGWIFLGILLWGPFELLTMAASDSACGVSTRPLKVELTPSDQPAPGRWDARKRAEPPKDDRPDWQRMADPRPRL